MHLGNIECRLEVFQITVKNIAGRKILLSAVYVYQMNLNGKLRKNWGSQAGGQANIWGAMATQAPP